MLIILTMLVILALIMSIIYFIIYKLTELKRGNTEATLRGCSLEMLFKKFEISQESISGENLQISVNHLDKCNWIR